ncbi:MAG: hypothetical protein DCC58_13235 [Chloroflexi bacterium]|nr:MAG: hypothetical protein DCC58_13235 [Chloroflexota bacterium]
MPRGIWSTYTDSPAHGPFLRLPATARQELQVAEALLRGEWSLANCAVAQDGDGYLVVIRLVNYRLGVPRPRRAVSRQILQYLDADLRPTATVELDCSLLHAVACHPFDVSRTFGVEDVRPFRWRGAWWFTGVSCNVEPYGNPRVVLGCIDQRGRRIEHLVELFYPEQLHMEKNWLPIAQGERLTLLYSTNPFVLLAVDPESGLCRTQRYSALLADEQLDLRGSGAPVNLPDGRLLYSVHGVADAGNGRTYWHCFVALDAGLEATHLSYPFVFEGRPVEFSCGHCLTHDGSHLLIAWSRDDSQCFISAVPLAEVERLLQPLALSPTG